MWSCEVRTRGLNGGAVIGLRPLLFKNTIISNAKEVAGDKINREWRDRAGEVVVKPVNIAA